MKTTQELINELDDNDNLKDYTFEELQQAGVLVSPLKADWKPDQIPF